MNSQKDSQKIIIYLTLLHLLAIRLHLIKYSCLVVFCTISSVSWHNAEHSAVLFIIDHILATIWGLVDFLMNPYTLLLNIPICILDWIIPHTWWHVLSAVKAVVIAYYFL